MSFVSLTAEMSPLKPRRVLVDPNSSNQKTLTGLLIKRTTSTQSVWSKQNKNKIDNLYNPNLHFVWSTLHVFIFYLSGILVQGYDFFFFCIQKTKQAQATQKACFLKKNSFTSPRVNIFQAHPHESLPFLKQFGRLWHRRSSCHHQWLQWHLRSPSWPGWF